MARRSTNGPVLAHSGQGQDLHYRSGGRQTPHAGARPANRQDDLTATTLTLSSRTSGSYHSMRREKNAGASSSGRSTASMDSHRRLSSRAIRLPWSVINATGRSHSLPIKTPAGYAGGSSGSLPRL